jgi:hypothetical protein
MTLIVRSYIIGYRSQKDNRPLNIKISSNNYGIYFSANKESTKIYGNKTKKYKLYLSHPLILKDKDWNLSIIPEYLYNKLKKEGYDSAIWLRKNELYEIVMFNKNNIKEI